MASFHAELHLTGTSYRVVRCRYACHQPTDARGRASSKVRHDLLHLALDVPTNDELLLWAATPHKSLSGQVVFYDAAQQVAHETIAFSAGECVGYREQFESGAAGDGAYVCHLTIAAAGFELRGGGPAGTPALEQVQRAVAVARQAQAAVQQADSMAAVAHEVSPESLAAAADKFSLLDPSTHFVRPAAPFDWELSQKLAQTFPISLNNPIGFAEAVQADLQAIYNTPTGRKLIESLQASGKKFPIAYENTNGAAFPNFPGDPYGLRGPNWEPAFFNEEGTAPGAGLVMNIGYNPFRETVVNADEVWHTRPPGVGLAHELIHAEQAVYGRMVRGKAPNPKGKAATQPATAHAYELETVGVPPYNTYALSENKIRSEWNPPQTLRTRY
jgi:hypothetical protein